MLEKIRRLWQLNYRLSPLIALHDVFVREFERHVPGLLCGYGLESEMAAWKKKGAQGYSAKAYSVKSYGVKSVGHYLPQITRPVFEKFGYQRAALHTDWHSIVGEPLCHFTAPEQIKHQTRGNEAAEFEQEGQKKGAVLVVRVEGPAALEVQHQAPQIIERINSYFGFRAIESIRILQAPLERKVTPPQPQRFDLNKPVSGENNISCDDDQLNTALKRLWRGIQSRKINDQAKK